MNILIASDSFKDSLSSKEFGRIVSETLNTRHNVEVLSVSDGGEGALEAISCNTNFKIEIIETIDALGRKIEAEVAIDLSNGKAFVEMAKICGLELLNVNERDAKVTSTYGLGLLVRKLYDRGIKDITMSIGGSATVDGGAGMLSALGVEFGLRNKKELSNSDLLGVEEIKVEANFLSDIDFTIAADVDNPLLGNNGAVYTYAVQKGARENELEQMERAMINLSQKCMDYSGVDYSKVEGSGAAGGLAFGLMNFYDIKLVSGTRYFLDFLSLDKRIKDYDLIISGEGSLDNQTLNSKLIFGLSQLCRRHNKRFFVVAGKIDSDIIKSNLADRYFELRRYAANIEDSIINASEYLKMASEEILDEL